MLQLPENQICNYLYINVWEVFSDAGLIICAYFTIFFFIPILKQIINLSLSSGVFPSFWKTVIVLIFKGGDASVLTNYHTVSLSCEFAKVSRIVVLDIHRCMFTFGKI